MVIIKKDNKNLYNRYRLFQNYYERMIMIFYQKNIINKLQIVIQTLLKNLFIFFLLLDY
jgi:hypothetical protein